MDKTTITTILQTYKRPSYLSTQLKAITEQSVKPDKIIIVHNEGGYKFDFPENAHVIYSSENMKFHLRFAIGLLTTTKYVFFFDDDTICGERFFEKAIELINTNNCIVVGNGRIIHAEEKKWDCPGWGNPCDEAIECDFGGHFIGLKKEYLKYMWYEDPIRYDNCEDMQISFNCFRFAGIKTFAMPHPLTDKSIWSSLKGNKFGSDSVASWITNPSHFEERWETIDNYISRGYIPLLKRINNAH